MRDGTPQGPVRVVLDPGHGGESDPGAVGPNGLAESAVNLRVALATRDALESRGISTALTRSADYGSTLTVRSGLADTLGAEVLISIHHNAPTPNRSAVPGTEIFVQTGSPDSRRLGGLLYDSIFGELSQIEDMTWSAAPDAGVLEVLLTSGADAYGMLRNPETVAALVELAYISHGPEADLLASVGYPERAAEAIVEAVTSYLETDSQGRGHVDTPRVFRPNRGVSSSACQEAVLD